MGTPDISTLESNGRDDDNLTLRNATIKVFLDRLVIVTEHGDEFSLWYDSSEFAVRERASQIVRHVQATSHACIEKFCVGIEAELPRVAPA
jgi:hypothetical protein